MWSKQIVKHNYKHNLYDNSFSVFTLLYQIRMNRKISRNEKQVLKRKKVVPSWRRKHKRSNKYWSGGWQQHFWIVGKLFDLLS